MSPAGKLKDKGGIKWFKGPAEDGHVWLSCLATECLVLTHAHKSVGVLERGHPLNLNTRTQSLLLVAMPFLTSSLLFLVVMPGATSSVLAPSQFGQDCMFIKRLCLSVA